MNGTEPRSQRAEQVEGEWLFAARDEVVAELARLDLAQAAEPPAHWLGPAQGILTGALLGGLSWALGWLVVTRLIG